MPATSAFSGLERKGEEFYQITLGGSGDERASIGEIIGKGFSTAEVVDAVETLVDTYIAKRESANEPFLETYRRARSGALQGGALWHCLKLSPGRSTSGTRPSPMPSS